MARLIDADKLIKEFESVVKRKGLNAKDKNKCMWCAWILDVIAQTSAVDAIPITWLKRWAENTVYERKTPNGEYRVIVYNDIIVQNIINDWEKERGDL